MSAYIVSKVHIDVLVSAGLHGTEHDRLRWYVRDPWQVMNETSSTEEYFRLLHEAKRELNHDTADAVGQMLVDENVRSVRFRYPDGILPGPVDAYHLEPYVWNNPRVTLEPVEVLQAIAGYEYQSCEHREWRTSEAHAFIRVLERAAIHRLPGYNEAPWEWTTEELESRPRTMSIYTWTPDLRSRT